MAIVKPPPRPDPPALKPGAPGNGGKPGDGSGGKPGDGSGGKPGDTLGETPKSTKAPGSSKWGKLGEAGGIGAIIVGSLGALTGLAFLPEQALQKLADTILPFVPEEYRTASLAASCCCSCCCMCCIILIVAVFAFGGGGNNN